MSISAKSVSWCKGFMETMAQEANASIELQDESSSDLEESTFE